MYEGLALPKDSNPSENPNLSVNWAGWLVKIFLPHLSSLKGPKVAYIVERQ